MVSSLMPTGETGRRCGSLQTSRVTGQLSYRPAELQASRVTGQSRYRPAELQASRVTGQPSYRPVELQASLQASHRPTGVCHLRLNASISASAAETFQTSCWAGGRLRALALRLGCTLAPSRVVDGRVVEPFELVEAAWWWRRCGRGWWVAAAVRAWVALVAEGRQ